MAELDSTIQAAVWTWMVPALAGYVVYRLLGRRLLLQVYSRCYAVVIDRIEKASNKSRFFKKRKEELFKELHTLSEEAKPRAIHILEVGAGSGSNFKFFPKGSNVMCIDPNPYFESYLQSKRELFADVNITEFVVGHGEDLSAFPDSSLDAVVCTLVLCSVEDIDQCLREFKRVLKPGGKFFYMEHVSADRKTWTCTLQKIMRPIWMCLADRCDPSKETWANVETAGFSRVEQERFATRIKIPFLAPHLMGVATK